MSFTVGQEVEVEVVDTDITKFLSESNYPVTGKLVKGFIVSRNLTELVEFINDKGESLRLALKPEQLKLANTFNSQKEIWEYLLAGGKVLSKETKYIYLIEKDKVSIVNMPNSIKSVDCNFRVFTNFTKYIEPKVVNWYDNIPKSGILCRVFQLYNSTYRYNIIYKYEPNTSYHFRTMSGGYKNAVPVTLEEAEELIYKPMIDIKGI